MSDKVTTCPTCGAPVILHEPEYEGATGWMEPCPRDPRTDEELAKCLRRSINWECELCTDVCDGGHDANSALAEIMRRLAVARRGCPADEGSLPDQERG